MSCVLFLSVYQSMLWGHRACSNKSSLRLRYFRRFGALRAQCSRRSRRDSGVAFRILSWVFRQRYTPSAVTAGSTTERSTTVRTPCRASRRWYRISPSSRKRFSTMLWLTLPVAGLR